jgi:hypothetical protein
MEVRLANELFTLFDFALQLTLAFFTKTRNSMNTQNVKLIFW